MEERELQKAVLEWLNRRDIFHWRVPLGGVAQAGGKFMSKNPMTGHPDIAGILPNSNGRYFAIELKTKRNQLSDRQKEWQKKLAASGCLCFVARTLDEVKYHFAVSQNIDNVFSS